MNDNKFASCKLVMRLISKVTHSARNLTERAFLDSFKNVKSDLDKVNFVYILLRKYHLFPRFNQDGKTDEIAKMHKEEGNTKYAGKLYLKALKIYTCSISTAESTELLALGYANRSACLMKLEMFQECLVDIERALENGYPVHLRPKLFARRAAALKSLKPVEPWHQEIPIIPESRRNKFIECAKDCVEIRNSEQFGRHIVATRDINIGEVIAVERPVVANVYEGKLLHCHECLKLCYNLIPCSTCTQALYCTENCKEKAFKAYHQYECAVLVTLGTIEVTDHILLPLKATFLSGISSQENPFPESLEDQIYQSGRYKEAHYLKRHADKFEGLNLLHQAVIAAVVFKTLKKKTNLFQNEVLEKNFKEIFYRQMHVCLFNTLAITEVIPNSSSNSNFGRGLYSFGSLLNHSCCPNVERCFYATAMVLRANNTVKKGKQCFISYGPQYGRGSSSQERQSALDKFHFICTCDSCEACRENWIPDIYQEMCLPFFLNGNPTEYLTKLERVEAGDLNETKNMLAQLQPALRFWEGEEAEIGKDIVDKVKRLIYECHTNFANKRRI